MTTPREYVIAILRTVFRTSEDEAYNIMPTAHKYGVCVVAVYTREVAETKATEATELANEEDYPLIFRDRARELARNPIQTCRYIANAYQLDISD